MKRTLKYVTFAIAALFAVFLLLVAYVVFTVNPNDYKPQIVNLFAEEIHRPLSLEGNIGLKLFPRLGLNLGKASMGGPGGRGEFASVGNVVLDVAWLPLLHGKLEIDRIDVDGLHVMLIRHRDGTTNYDDLVSGKEGGKGKTEFDIGGVEVKNSSISFENEKSAGKIEIENIALKTGRLKEGVHTDIALGMDVRQGKETSHLDLAGGLLVDPDRYKLDGIDLKFKSGKHVATAKGSAQIDAKQETASADLSSTFDESHVKAKLSMAGFSSPVYRFDVGVDKLDADRYLAKGSGDAAPGPFDLSFLKKLNASGKLAIRSLKVYGLRLSNFGLGLKAADSRLDLAPVKADLYDGKADGKIAVQAASIPRFSIKQSLTGISIGPLIRDAMNKGIIEGRGNVSVDVKAAGSFFSELKKTLNGKAAIRLTDGAVRGFDLGALLRGIKSKSGAASAAEKTDFSELSATFDIRNGVAHNSDLSAKSPLVRLGGEGDIDLGKSALNYLAKVSVVSTLEGQGGAELSSLRGVTVPLRISGPFDALHYSLDIGSMTSSALKSKMEEKRNELLKGLFGR